MLVTLPFELRPKEEDVISNEFTKGLQFHDVTTLAALWTRYWAIYIGE
ncbi:MAG TPA: hypothetical protein VEP90_11210 [Methylomirabilota bacterium]|nr:hypothetical protein [Methylomirabilota bacterium]